MHPHVSINQHNQAKQRSPETDDNWALLSDHCHPDRTTINAHLGPLTLGWDSCPSVLGITYAMAVGNNILCLGQKIYILS